MAFIDNPRRITPDEFPEEYQELIERFAEYYNFFVENTTNVVNGRLDFDNLNRQLIEITLVVDENGTPIGSSQFSSDVGLIGINVLRAVNNTNSNTFPTSSPFISYSASGTGLYTIRNINGLPAGNSFTLTLELIF